MIFFFNPRFEASDTFKGHTFKKEKEKKKKQQKQRMLAIANEKPSIQILNLQRAPYTTQSSC